MEFPIEDLSTDIETSTLYLSFDADYLIWDP